MTDAHTRAVEAAWSEIVEWIDCDNFNSPGAHVIANNAITAYLAAMREAGRVMVRDCKGRIEVTNSQRRRDYIDGWNACRAAMLKGAGDEQG